MAFDPARYVDAGVRVGRFERDPILRDDIYRIAREALRNVFNHAQASKIEAEIYL